MDAGERALAEIFCAMNNPGHPGVRVCMCAHDPFSLEVVFDPDDKLRHLIYARGAVADAYGTYDPTEVVASLNAFFLTSGLFVRRGLFPTATVRDGALAVRWATLTQDDLRTIVVGGDFVDSTTAATTSA